MTYEPGTADIFTTMPPPFPGGSYLEDPPDLEEVTVSGWRIKHWRIPNGIETRLYNQSGTLISRSVRMEGWL